MNRRPPFSPRLQRFTARRGTVYLIVLTTGLLVLLLGLGGMAVARSLGRTMDRGAEAAAARWYAESAIEIARATINQTSNWRTTRTNGAWLTDVAIGNGTMSVDVTNPSGALGRSFSDSVVVTGTGKCGQAVQVVKATLRADQTPRTCLNVSMCAGGLTTLTGATVGPSGNTIASNAGVTAALATVNANTESAGAILGLTFKGTTAALGKAHTLPDSSVFDFYIANGTSILYSSLNGKIENCLLSPTSNSFGGGLNAQGIYIIDCNNQPLKIRDCRIVGTLVVLNTSGCTADKAIIWEPAVANFPCLMIQGDLQLKTDAANLLEGTANLNPASTPYPFPGGVSNTTQSDSYLNRIVGLVYVSGNLTTSSSPAANLIIVGGTVACSGTLTLNYDATYANSPPPGFANVVMRPQLGTYAR